jgi:hypothetical protein
MLKREIEYEDFEGEKQKEVFYFNLSKPELVEMEVEVEGGLGVLLDRIVKSENRKELVKYFKQIVLMSYGVKSEDGKRFIKSDKLREEFSQTAAYEALFMELSTNDGAASDFVKGIMPKDLVSEIEKAEKTELAPVPDSPPKTT